MLLSNTFRILLLSGLFFFGVNSKIIADDAHYGEVVTTIAPIHALVSRVLKGSGIEATLLVGEGSSLHGFMLKPSQHRLLSEAKLVVMMSMQMEVFLNKPLKTYEDSLSTLQLADNPSFQLLEKNSQHHHDEEPLHKPEVHQLDYHLWLDPIHLIEMLSMIADSLVDHYPSMEVLLLDNMRSAQAELNQLHKSLEIKMNEIKDKPYIVFHDAYSYFEHRYGLHQVGVISIDPSHGLSAKQVLKIKQIVADKNVRCVFSEPQFSDKIIQTLSQESHLNVAVLNPLYGKGDDVTSTIVRLSESFFSCLN